MKNVILLSLVLFISTMFSQTDTLCNPSFEDSLNNWGNFCNGNAVGNFIIDSNAAFNGNLGLKVSISNVNLPSTCALTSCMLNLQQGKYYKISFWAKADSTSNLLVVLQNSSAPFTNHADNIFSISNNWEKYSIYTSDSVQLNNVKIKIKPQSDGVYFLDDIMIEAINFLPFNTNICEGDFENGITSWSQSNSGGNINVVSENVIVQNGLVSAKATVSNTSVGQPIFSSCKSDIKKNTKYKIHFWIKSDAGGQQLIATSSLSTSPYTNYGQTTVDVLSSWVEHTFITDSDTSIYDNVRFAKFKFLNDGNFYIDNIWIEELPAQPFFCNGDFELGLDDWTQTINNGAVASMSIALSQAQSGMQSAMILLNTSGSSNGSVQLSSCKTDIVKDSSYTVSFWVKGSSADLNFNAISSLGSAPFTSFSSNSYKTSNIWQEYCYTFSHDSTIISDVRLLKLQFLDPGTYFIDNVTVNSPNYLCSSITSNLVDQISAVKVYPNPAKNSLTIENISASYNEIGIYDVFGKKQLLIPAIRNKITIDVVDFQSGLYFIKFIDSTGNLQSRRWVKN
jgi:hypothetical protein